MVRPATPGSTRRSSVRSTRSEGDYRSRSQSPSQSRSPSRSPSRNSSPRSNSSRSPSQRSNFYSHSPSRISNDGSEGIEY